MNDLNVLVELLKVMKNYSGRIFTLRDGVFISAYDNRDDDDEFGFTIVLDHGFGDLGLPEGCFIDGKEMYGLVSDYVKYNEVIRKERKIKPKDVAYLYTVIGDELHLSMVYEDKTITSAKVKLVLIDYVKEEVINRYFAKASEIIGTKVSTYDLPQESIDILIDMGILTYLECDHFGEQVVFPVLASMLKRKKYDTAEIAIRDTAIPNICQYSVYLDKSNVRETLSTYIVTI